MRVVLSYRLQVSMEYQILFGCHMGGNESIYDRRGEPGGRGPTGRGSVQERGGRRSSAARRWPLPATSLPPAATVQLARVRVARGVGSQGDASTAGGDGWPRLDHHPRPLDHLVPLLDHLAPPPEHIAPPFYARVQPGEREDREEGGHGRTEETGQGKGGEEGRRRNGPGGAAGEGFSSAGTEQVAAFSFSRENASERANSEPIQRSGALYSRTGKLAARGEGRGIGSQFYNPILSTTKH
jgi:hypothetical protein